MNPLSTSWNWGEGGTTVGEAAAKDAIATDTTGKMREMAKYMS